MKKRVGLIGSIMLGAAMVTVGLSGNLALAGQNNHGQNNQGQNNHGQNNQGQNNHGQNNQGQTNQGQTNHGQSGSYAVPEPSSVILLGAAVLGLGIWSWRRKSTES